MAYIFDTSRGETPQSIAMKRQLAARILGGRGLQPARNVGEGIGQGLASIGDGIVANVLNRRAAQAEQQGQAGAQDQLTALYGSAPAASPSYPGSPSSIAADPASARVAQAHSNAAAPGQFSGSQQEFVDMLMPAALEASKRTGIDPRIIVAQAAQETGWGRSAPGNNFFGIKSHGKGGGQNLKTHEYVNGKRVNISDSFRTFGSPDESVAGYADFILQNPRYRALMQAQGLDAQLDALQASGYATDPNYSRSVGSIARGIQMPATGQDANPNAAIASSLTGSPVAPEVPMAGGASGFQPQQQPPQVAQAGEPSVQQLLDILNNPFQPEGVKEYAGMLLKQRHETPKRQNLINAGEGQLYDPNSGEWILAPSSGQAGFRMANPDEAAAYGAQAGQFGPDGRFYPINPPTGMSIESDGQGGFRLVQGPGAGAGRPLTEGQGKDVGFATRAEGALPVLDQFDTYLTSPTDRALEHDPTGMLRRNQSPEFQQAYTAGLEFLQAILRKDTGAAITKQEIEEYGRVYLPQPGDSEQVLQQKRTARRRALEALKAGMPPHAILMQESALERSGGGNVDAGPPPEVDPELWEYMTPEERRAFQ